MMMILPMIARIEADNNAGHIHFDLLINPALQAIFGYDITW